MNNGLNGRYMAQLEAWNNARKFAAELVEAFYENGISEVLSEWKETVSFPSLSEIKTLLNRVVFMNGHDTIDTIARSVIDWEGWEENTIPSMQSNRQKVVA